MATDIVRDVNMYAHSTKVRDGWTLRRKTWPKRWAPNLGSFGAYVREAKTPAGFTCFRVCFPNGKHCYCETLAEAQEYLEANVAANLMR